jgi:hypothetical protein
MKKLVILGFFGLLLSCQDKEVLLPMASETIVADVNDHSPIYFFFKIENKDTLVDVNRKNAISSTNWLYNIDKRLPLRKVILEVKKLQNKQASSMHKNKKSENYFTYTDTVKKTMAFLAFTKIHFKLEKPDLTVNYFYLDRNDLVHFRDLVFSKNELEAFINKLFIEHKSNIYFAYDKGMSFGKYIEYEFFIKRLLITKKGISINNNIDYIY